MLSKGEKLSNEEIKTSIINQFGMSYQNNTIAKYLSFLIKQRKVLSAPVDNHGKVFFVYWWIQKPKKSNKKLITLNDLLNRVYEIEKTYPIEHPECKKIRQQRIALESVKNRETEYIKMEA